MNQTQMIYDAAYELSLKLDIPLAEAMKIFLLMRQNQLIENQLTKMNETLAKGVQNIVSLHKNITLN